MAPATNQRASRTNAGDYTGKEKARQSREQRMAERERGAETTMATAAQDWEEEHAVFDGETQQRIDAHEIELVDDDEDDDFDDAPQQFASGAFDDDDEPVLTGHETEEQLAPILAKRNEPRARRRSPRAHSAEVVVRVDQDIDDMTYGIDQISLQPKNYTFKEGLKYRMSYDLAEHLNERGLVRQWVSG